MKFTPAQIKVLRALDDSSAPVEFDGTARRTLDFLKEKGLVTFRRTHKSVSFGPARGSHLWSHSRVVLIATLTKEGADFIYNGGIDK